MSSSEPWSGEERRKRKRLNRLVYSQGPIIRSLEILSGFSGLAAVGALLITLTSFGGQLNTIQTARQNSAYDTCKVLNILLVTSGNVKHQRPVYSLSGKVIGYIQFGPSRDEADLLKTFLDKTGLNNCTDYSKRVRDGRLPGPGGQ